MHYFLKLIASRPTFAFDMTAEERAANDPASAILRYEYYPMQAVLPR
jgi:hypothetical protein